MADWPAYFYGPNGEAEIFQRAEDVPEGWADTPAAFAVGDELVIPNPDGSTSVMTPMGKIVEVSPPPRKKGRPPKVAA